MSLQTKRLLATKGEPFALEVSVALPSASLLLWHIARLPGAKVLAKKSWVLTDDFEAYFLYKGRLFVMQTPFVNVWVSQLGEPPDEHLFAEVERKVQSFSWWLLPLIPLTLLKYSVLPVSPPRELLVQHGAHAAHVER